MSSVWRRLYVHLVWGTRHRLPIIDAGRVNLIGKMFRQSALHQDCEVLAFGAVEDHVHLLISLHTTSSVAKLVRAMKSATTTEIERTDARDPPFAWQSGYAVLSVEPDGASVLRGYIERQKQHHAEGMTRAEWNLRLLRSIRIRKPPGRPSEARPLQRRAGAEGAADCSRATEAAPHAPGESHYLAIAVRARFPSGRRRSASASRWASAADILDDAY